MRPLSRCPLLYISIHPPIVYQDKLYWLTWLPYALGKQDSFGPYSHKAYNQLTTNVLQLLQQTLHDEN